MVEDENKNKNEKKDNNIEDTKKESRDNLEGYLKKIYYGIIALIGISIIILGFQIYQFMQSSSLTSNQSSSNNLIDSILSFAIEAPLPNVTNTINYYANNNTNIILYEFSDFDCPYCDIWSVMTYPVINQTYISKGLINFVYEYFPLYQIHPYANITALYGSCIAKYYGEKGFEKWYDFIFGVNNNITTIDQFEISGFWMKWNNLKNQSQVIEFINNNLPSLGFNQTLIYKCVSSRQTYNEVYSLENYFSQKYGVDGTPTFIIAVNTNILNQQSLQDIINTMNQLKSLGLSYQLYYTPDKKYIMIEFAGALPPQYFEEILNATGANKY